MPTLRIPKESPQHRRLKNMIMSRIKMAQRMRSDQEDKWRKAEEIVGAYVHESEADRVRKNRIDNGEPSYVTIQLPYSYALLMSAHTYQTSVFFGRDPVHQYSGRHGETEMQIQALEALISYQTDVGQHMAPYYIWTYDSNKYGLGILGTYWCEEMVSIGQLIEMPDPQSGRIGLYEAQMQLPGYMGNKVYNVSPFDFWHDPRVTTREFQKGEFCFVLKRLMWNDVVKRQAQGYYMNIDELRRRATTKKSDESSASIKRPDWHTFKMYEDDVDDNRREEKATPAGAFVYEFYVDLIPKDWDVGESTYPQKWCFTITEDMDLIIGASPFGHLHAQFPFDVMESEVEGYSTYPRGIPQIIQPLQETMDWLVNSHFYNIRAALNNQFIVDPSKVVLSDVESGEPGFIWRLRPEAFGSDIDKIFKQVPVTDVTRTHFTDVQQMFSFGERALGINEQIMGVLNTGGRKTATEVRTAAGFGVNRMKTVTEYQSALAFAPHSQKLVQNSQQFYDAEMKFKIVGDLSIAAGAPFMMVQPQDIAGFFSFVPVNGTLPVDRMAQANLWKDLMGQLRGMPPQIAMGFDWTKIFEWVGSLAGLKNIRNFRVQLVPDGSMGGQVQQGNVIPFQPGAPRLAPGASSSTQSGLNALAPPTPGMTT